MSEGIDIKERASAVALLATGTGSEGVRLAVERAITAALADRDAAIRKGEA